MPERVNYLLPERVNYPAGWRVVLPGRSSSRADRHRHRSFAARLRRVGQTLQCQMFALGIDGNSKPPGCT
jgi:hypothetical protein